MMRGLEKFNKLVEAFEKLPTVGRKSAVRFAYHLVLNDTFSAMKLANAIESAIKSIRKCERCGALSEHEICDICLDDRRDVQKLCMVESAKDIFVIEDSNQFDGRYFVIEELNQDMIDALNKFIINNEVENILFAITPSIANDAFILFIEDKLKAHQIKFTKIAQGVPTGVSLENVDILSLSKAIQSKVEI